MSISQQIRDAMQRLGAPSTSTEIADAIDDDITTHKVSMTLGSGIQQGWCEIDRTERPYRYSLIEERVAAVDAFHSGAHRKGTPGKAKRELKARKVRAANSSPSHRRLATAAKPATAAPTPGRSASLANVPTHRSATAHAQAQPPPASTAVDTDLQQTLDTINRGKPPQHQYAPATPPARTHHGKTIEIPLADLVELAALALAGCVTDHARDRVLATLRSHA